MSFYSILSFDPPIIAYSALHQVRKGVGKNVYTATMQDLHRLVREESAQVQKAWISHRSAVVSKTVHSIRAHLSPFLATPPKSDDHEIRKYLSEALNQLTDQVTVGEHLGTITTLEGRILLDQQSSPVLKPLLAAGKRYLTNLAFDLGKVRRDVFESNFIIEGGLNLDVIEHIVRDRIGIYTPVHGKHIKEFDAYAYAAHNLVYASGDHAVIEPVREAAIFFSKGATRYAPFRNGAVELLQTLSEHLHLSHSSLWQRKLGLGVGSEFVVRFRFKDYAVLSEIISLIKARDKKSFVSEAIFNSGHLLVKELIPITP